MKPEETVIDSSQAVQTALQHVVANMLIILCVIGAIHLIINWTTWDNEKHIIFMLTCCFIVSVMLSLRTGKEVKDYAEIMSNDT